MRGILADIGSMDTLEHAHISGAQIILSTIPDMLLRGTSNKAMVTACRALAPNAYIVATADSAEQIDVLKKKRCG
jgi:Trk K+ transport system NAD-binding subunit